MWSSHSGELTNFLVWGAQIVGCLVEKLISVVASLLNLNQFNFRCSNSPSYCHCIQSSDSFYDRVLWANCGELGKVQQLWLEIRDRELPLEAWLISRNVIFVKPAMSIKHNSPSENSYQIVSEFKNSPHLIFSKFICAIIHAEANVQFEGAPLNRNFMKQAKINSIESINRWIQNSCYVAGFSLILILCKHVLQLSKLRPEKRWTSAYGFLEILLGERHAALYLCLKMVIQFINYTVIV